MYVCLSVSTKLVMLICMLLMTKWCAQAFGADYV